MLSKNDLTRAMRKNSVTITLGALLLIFAVMNVFLLMQNIGLRRDIRKLEPDKLNVGDRLEPFSVSGIIGGCG